MLSRFTASHRESVPTGQAVGRAARQNFGSVAQSVEQLPFKQLVGGSSPPGLTKKEMVAELGAALAAPASADSAAKGKFKFAESRRFIKKKFEPTFFAMIDKSWQLFFARAIF